MSESKSASDRQAWFGAISYHQNPFLSFTLQQGSYSIFGIIVLFVVCFVF